MTKANHPPRPRSDLFLALITLAMTAALGVFAWKPSSTGLLLLLLLPPLMNLFKWGYWPFAVAFVYFGTGNVELPAVIDRFQLGEASPLVAWSAPVLLTAIQALPFLVYRADRNPNQRAGLMLIALLLLTLPGVGFVAWRNPLLLAGLLFPGLGLLGLLATAALFALMAAGGFSWQPKRKAITIAGAAAVTLALGSMWSLQRNPVIDLDGWVGMDTAIEPENMRNRREVREVVPGEVAAQALTAALEENATVVVLPESILAPATLADEIALLPAAEKARKKGAVLLLGETIRTDAVSWRNTIRAVGAVEGTFAESRLPMPFGNWQLSGGVPVRPFASDVSVLNLPSGPINVATSLCFEDTVILPHLGLLTGQADVLVSTANSWATAGTRGDETQTLSAKLLARLGGVPLVRARNTYEGAMK